MPENRGLGAAVRVGLHHAVHTFIDPIAVAFADADGEYAPEELARLIEPIVAGEADYVVGSRFRGEIGRMLPHSPLRQPCPHDRPAHGCEGSPHRRPERIPRAVGIGRGAAQRSSTTTTTRKC